MHRITVSSCTQDINITPPPSVLSSLVPPLLQRSMASVSSAPLSTPAIPTAPVLSFSDSSIFFPPRHLSDFEIHYRDTSFHVHQLVLHCNSEYFRTYLGSHNEGSTGHKRQRTDSTASPTAVFTNEANPCTHSSSTACIQLPLLRTGDRDTSIDEVGLFLCHLYFPSHYRYPPYLSLVDIDLGPRAETASATVGGAFPAIEDEEFNTELRMHADHLRPFLNESALSLVSHFRCQQVTKQCEAGLIRECDAVDWTMDCWQTLRLAQVYKLDKAVFAACGKYMMMSNGLSEEEIFGQTWASRETLLHLLWSAIVNKRAVETQSETQKPRVYSVF